MSIQTSLKVHGINPQEVSESFFKHKSTISVLFDSLKT